MRSVHEFTVAELKRAKALVVPVKLDDPPGAMVEADLDLATETMTAEFPHLTDWGWDEKKDQLVLRVSLSKLRSRLGKGPQQMVKGKGKCKPNFSKRCRLAKAAKEAEARNSLPAQMSFPEVPKKVERTPVLTPMYSAVVGNSDGDNLLAKGYRKVIVEFEDKETKRKNVSWVYVTPDRWKDYWKPVLLAELALVCGFREDADD